MPRSDYSGERTTQWTVGSDGKIDGVTAAHQPAHKVHYMNLPAAHFASRANLKYLHHRLRGLWALTLIT
jgi:hypothetical protein